MRKCSCAVLICLVFASQSLLSAQSQKQTAALLDAFLTQATAFGYSGAALVAVDGKVVLEKGFGLADRESGRAIAVTDVFDIGSITKQFTAAAIMKLEMQGKLRTDDLLSKYVEGVPADKADVTLHHLLTHTAGFPEYSGGDYEVSERDETILRILKTPLTGKPGAAMNYSNAGYSVLAAVVEKVSGQSYETFLNESLFKPAGMKRTGYVLPKFDKTSLPHGYNGDEHLGTALDHRWSPTGPYWNLLGNGGIFSTIGDMYLWYRALQGNEVLSAEARNKMFTPFLNNYAYGWTVAKTKNGMSTGHGGASDNGFNARLTWYPEKNTVIIVASNAGDYYGGSSYSGLVSNKITSLVFAGGQMAPPPPRFEKDDPAFQRYSGTYRLPDGSRFLVGYKNNRLSIEPAGQGAVDALTDGSKMGSAAAAKLSGLAETVVNGIATGDFEPLKRNTPDEAIFGRYRTYFEQRMKTWSTSDGAYQNFEVLGTIPVWWSENVVPATIVKLKFAKRDRIFRFHWSEGKINAVGGEGIPSPITIPLRPIAANTFYGSHLTMALPVSVKFTIAKDEITAVSVTTGGMSAKALRVK